MKTQLLILALAGMFWAGCGDDGAKKPAPSTNAAASVITAPVDYLGAVVQAQKHAEKVIDVSYLNQAIQMFNVQEGHLPKTLNELVPNYVGKIPATPYGTKLSYDPATGTVKVVKQ